MKYKYNLNPDVGVWVAVVLSYAINHSILWCILHYFMGWLYVVYWLFAYTDIVEYINAWVVY
jgi:hypothetical protein